MPKPPKTRPSDDEPKSALELAMEKLRRRDEEAGVGKSTPLREDQKQRIAEIRREYEARLAQLEIMREAELRKALASPDPAEAIAKLDENTRRDRQRIEE